MMKTFIPGHSVEEVQHRRGELLPGADAGPALSGGGNIIRYYNNNIKILTGGAAVLRRDPAAASHQGRGHGHGGQPLPGASVLPHGLLRAKHPRRQDGGQNIPRNRGLPQTVLY